ncbi:MAG: fibronectin type III domain-containing protein [Acidobacteriota bacterium]
MSEHLRLDYGRTDSQPRSGEVLWLVAHLRRPEQGSSRLGRVLAKTGVMLVCLLVLAVPLRLMAENATFPEEVTVPHPTICNLAIEWKIRGDDNLNGRVAVHYRPAGESKWRQAMELRRVLKGDSGERTRPTFFWENKHSGSIFDLRPGTEYEIRLRLTDSDGGSTERTVSARTRRVPKAGLDARTKAATPVNFKEIAAALEPGDVLHLSPGYYGAFAVARDGKPDKPIVIRGDLSHSLKSTFDRVSLEGRKHVILEKVTVNGSVDLQGAEAVAVRHCTVNAQYGIIASRPPGCKDCYIADNVVTYVMPWLAEGMGSGSVWGGAANVGEGIQVTGPGNVICHNRVKGYRDCISLMEDESAYNQVSEDIYNNDIYVGADDAIEADFCMGNCRVLRNRITNCFIGLSSQPSLGGPIYFVRNAMYNLIETPFKLERHSVGNVFLHNTAVKVGDGFRVPHGPNEYSHSLFRNNLCVGGLGGGTYGRYPNGTGRALYTPETDPTNDFDYDGVGTHGTPFLGSIGRVLFFSIEELRNLTTEKHSVQVDMNVFNEVDFPYPPIPERETPDLRPQAGSVVVDVGLYIPNVNDDFLGAAPDLGAYEAGQALPSYGPRPEGVDEETLLQKRDREGRQ